MFVPLWAIFLVTGLTMAVITVVWAIRTRQFEEQKRARFIPLAGMSEAELVAPAERSHRAEKIGVMALVVVGGAAIGACLLLTVL